MLLFCSRCSAEEERAREEEALRNAPGAAEKSCELKYIKTVGKRLSCSSAINLLPWPLAALPPVEQQALFAATGVLPRSAVAIAKASDAPAPSEARRRADFAH